MTTVSFVEDDAGFHGALASILRSSPRHTLLDACRSSEEAGPLLLSRPPALALIDIQLPGASGIALVAELAPRLRDTAFIMITSFDSDAAVFDALRAGAVGYLVKDGDFSPPTLLAALDDATRGGSPMSWAIARRVVASLHQKSAPAAEPVRTPELQSLSPREQEVLGELARGLLYKQIADRLGLSEHTIRIHIRGIYRKLHVNSRTEAVVKYLGR